MAARRLRKAKVRVQIPTCPPYFQLVNFLAVAVGSNPTWSKRLCHDRKAMRLVSTARFFHQGTNSKKLWVKPPFASSNLAVPAMNRDLVKWSNTAVKLNVPCIYGGVAQRLLHLLCKQAITGSSPVTSTIFLKIAVASKSLMCYN